MMKALLGKKVGMTTIFDDVGNQRAVTVLEVGPCYVTQVKTVERDQYDAVQLGFGPRKAKRTPKPVMGHLRKAGLDQPLRLLREFRFDDSHALKPGDVLSADLFKVGEKVTVTGTSKGRGFAGVVKRHGFRGGPRTHGQSNRLRAPGSLGQSSSPSRVFKNVRMGGHMGNRRVSTHNMTVLRVIPEQHMLMVEGAVPGANNGFVEVAQR